MAVFVNPDTLQAIRRPAELADELKENGFVLVPQEKAKEAEEKPKAKKAKE